MGWGDCGKDSKGRPIGYVFGATCDHSGCKTRIHRGLAHACGGMHGSDEYSCERYFCSEHRAWIQVSPGTWMEVCPDCEADFMNTRGKGQHDSRD